MSRASKICTQLSKSLYEAKHLEQTVDSSEARRLDKFAGSEDKNIIFYSVFSQGHSIQAARCRRHGPAACASSVNLKMDK